MKIQKLHLKWVLVYSIIHSDNIWTDNKDIPRFGEQHLANPLILSIRSWYLIKKRRIGSGEIFLNAGDTNKL